MVWSGERAALKKRRKWNGSSLWGEGVPHTELEFYFGFGLLLILLSPASNWLDTAQVFTPVLGFSPCLPFPPAPFFSYRWPQKTFLWEASSRRALLEAGPSPVTLQHWSHVSFLILHPPLAPFPLSLNGFHWIHINWFIFLPKSHLLTFSCFPTTWTLDVKAFLSLDLGPCLKDSSRQEGGFQTRSWDQGTEIKDVQK